ncbi:MAG: hypothetical protein IJQ94_00130 [Bacteroidales bacterium]|nr:hypothetical protein [Bacteroidales bacterium]
MMPIVLGLFFVAFVMDDYEDEAQKTKSVFAECLVELDADESDCDENDIAEEASIKLQIPETAGTFCVSLPTLEPSSCTQSVKQFRGLVPRYAPNPASTYIEFFYNGIDSFSGLCHFLF